MDFDWELVRKMAEELKADGCTGVIDFSRDCCLHHDIMYRTGKCCDGTKVTRAEADRLFRLCMQRRSIFGVCSPMSWVRWLGVRVFGCHAWKGCK